MQNALLPSRGFEQRSDLNSSSKRFFFNHPGRQARFSADYRDFRIPNFQILPKTSRAANCVPFFQFQIRRLGRTDTFKQLRRVGPGGRRTAVVFRVLCRRLCSLFWPLTQESKQNVGVTQLAAELDAELVGPVCSSRLVCGFHRMFSAGFRLVFH